MLELTVVLPKSSKYATYRSKSCYEEFAMSRISEDDLKTRGVTAIENALRETTEAIVSVRGKDTYVVMTLDQYSHLRTCELEAAIHETRKDLAECRFVTKGPVDRVKGNETAPFDTEKGSIRLG